MRNTRLLATLSGVVLFAIAGSVSAAEEWGTLKGQFIFKGKAPEAKKVNVNKDTEVFGKLGLVDETLLVDDGGGVANVVLYVKSKDVKVNPDVEKNLPKKVLLDNKGGRFEPHILPVWIDKQVLELGNSDPVGHNSNLQPLGDAPATVNPLIPPKQTVEVKFSRKQTLPQPVGCNIHPWMRGFVLPRDNPYTAISNPDGTFEIKDLPVGELEFQAWHEKSGYLATGIGKESDKRKKSFTLKIKPGENDLGTILISP